MTMTGDPIRRLELPAGESLLDPDDDDSQFVMKPEYRIRGFKQWGCMAGIEALRKAVGGEDKGRAMDFGRIEMDKRGSILVALWLYITGPVGLHLSCLVGPFVVL